MSPSELTALVGFAVAAAAMLLVTQTKHRISAPGWLIPAAVAVPFALLTGLAIVEEGLFGFSPILQESRWGLQMWFDRLLCVAAAFFLLQNRARAVGMKSEVWVLAVIFTGAIGLFGMLARTVYLERSLAAQDR